MMAGQVVNYALFVIGVAALLSGIGWSWKIMRRLSCHEQVGDWEIGVIVRLFAFVVAILIYAGDPLNRGEPIRFLPIIGGYFGRSVVGPGVRAL